MYYEVADKASLMSAGLQLQAVSMAGANAVYVNITVYNVSSISGATVVVQQSNDMENWEDVGSSTSITAAGYLKFSVTAIAAQYVRLKFVATSGTAILAAGINTANL